MAERFLDGTTVAADSTSVITTFELESTTTGIALTGQTKDTCCAYYWRPGGSVTSIPLTNLSLVTSNYSSGGMIELGATSFCGRYRIDTPDLMWRQNADFVELHVWASGAKPFRQRYAITGGTTIANCVRNQIIEDCGRIKWGESQSLILATTVGVSGTSGTVRKDPSGCATRVTATIDANNNRTAITVNPSSGL